ncbi:MAG: hypothetical protein KAI74_02000, partial [Kiritimatiellae bacterium]|nr:hypothetical protein [Kiritimatiellia bacterium]
LAKNASELQTLAYHADPEQYAEVIHQLQLLAKNRDLGIPLHIAIDQEGDFSCDYARGGVSLAPSAMGVTAAGDPKLAYEVYKSVGLQLRSIGVTMVHSPVVDVNINPLNPEICTRAFSDDPELVTQYAAACMKGFMAAGVYPTAKHFPGRGDSDVDLHYDFDVDMRSLEEYEALDLIPYRALVSQGLPAIMISHQVCPCFGDEDPATVSRSIYNFVRESLGFNGVITTDAMGMRGVLERFGSLGDACAASIAMGADLVLAKCHPDLELGVFESIKRYVEEGKITEASLDEKITRILNMKKDQGLFDEYFDPAEARDVIKDKAVVEPIKTVCSNSIMKIRDNEDLLPLKPEQKVLVIEPTYKEWQGKGWDCYYHPGMLSLNMEKYSRNIKYVETSMDLNADELADIVKVMDEYDVIVINNFYWRSRAGNSELSRQLIGKGVPVIVVATAPYETVCVPEAKTLIVTWGQVPECQRAAADLLFGKIEARGVWPLTWQLK